MMNDKGEYGVWLSLEEVKAILKNNSCPVDDAEAKKILDRVDWLYVKSIIVEEIKVIGETD